MERFRTRAFEVGIPEGWVVDERPETLNLLHQAEPNGSVSIAAFVAPAVPEDATRGPELDFDAAASELGEDEENVALRWLGYHDGVGVLVIWVTPADGDHDREMADVKQIVGSLRILGDTEAPKIPDEFVEKMRKAIEEELGAPVTRSGPAELTAGAATVFLENVYLTCLRDPEREDEEIARFAEAMRTSMQSLAQDAELDLDADAEALRPMIKLEKEAEDFGYAARPFVGPFVIAYALEREHTLTYVTAELMREKGLHVDTLHELAMANLASIEFATYLEDGFAHLLVNDSFNASRLLFPDIGHAARETLELAKDADVLVAVPSRDHLVFAPVEKYEDFGVRVMLLFAAAPHALDPTVLLLSGEQLTVFDPSKAKPFWKKIFGS